MKQPLHYQPAETANSNELKHTTHTHTHTHTHISNIRSANASLLYAVTEIFSNVLVENYNNVTNPYIYKQGTYNLHILLHNINQRKLKQHAEHRRIVCKTNNSMKNNNIKQMEPHTQCLNLLSGHHPLSPTPLKKKEKKKNYKF